MKFSYRFCTPSAILLRTYKRIGRGYTLFYYVLAVKYKTQPILALFAFGFGKNKHNNIICLNITVR